MKLVSGDIDATAIWIEKVSWRIVESFPADTENPVTITFYDENGGIALASINTDFTTGAGDEHSFEITADQWEIDRWDSDGDGISNLMELAQGGDPRSATNAIQPLADNFVHAFSFIPTIESGFYHLESDIPELGEPVSIDDDTFVGGEFGSTTTTRDITLSADGNGTYSDTWFNFIYGDKAGIRNWNGTRSSQGNTVSWSGKVEVQLASSIAYPNYDDNFEVSSTISGQELKQVATSTINYPRFRNPGRLVHGYDIVLDLDSMDADGKCAILHGSLTQTRGILAEEIQVYTANRTTSDARWEWTISTNENVVSGESSSIKNRFYCDFQFQQSNLNRSNDQFSLQPEIEWATSLYESELLTHRLPANVQNETLVRSSESQSLSSTRNINISAQGNGTFSGSYSDNFDWVPPALGDIEVVSSGTRSSQGNTVSWSGTEAVTGRRYSRSYEETVFDISNTINGSELMQTSSGSIAYKENGTPSHSYQYDIVLDLRSINSENTCSVLRGQLSITTEILNENSDRFGLLNQATASRSSSDEQWAWTKTVDGETQSGLATVLDNRFHCEYLFNERF